MNHPASPARRLAVASAALLIAVATLVAACGSAVVTPAGPTPSRAPTGPPVTSSPSVLSPSPTETEPLPTPSPSPTPFHVVNAASCASSVVPDAAPAPSISPAAASKLVLKVPILMYHRIIPYSEAGNSNTSLVVSPDRFAAQLDALWNAGWNTITLSQLAGDLAAGVAPPAKTFVITIDDGWYDGYKYALPILMYRGFVATYFVIAGRIDKPDFLSADELRAIVRTGSEIGDHTMDHVNLGGGTDASRTSEIDSAAATIAAVTGQWPDVLAYPAGNYNARAVAAVQACSSMRLAVIEGNGTYETWATRFTTPRVKVYPGTSPAMLLTWVQNPWIPAPRTAAPTAAAPTAAAPTAAAPSSAPSTAPTAAASAVASGAASPPGESLPSPPPSGP